MTDEEKAARRAELIAEIIALQVKLRKATEYKAELIDERETTHKNVYTPVIKYDLKVSTDMDHWAGKLEDEAETKRSDLSHGIMSIISGINIVIMKLDNVIRRITEEIEAKQSELESL